MCASVQLSRHNGNWHRRYSFALKRLCFPACFKIARNVWQSTRHKPQSFPYKRPAQIYWRFLNCFLTAGEIFSHRCRGENENAEKIFFYRKHNFQMTQLPKASICQWWPSTVSIGISHSRFSMNFTETLAESSERQKRRAQIHRRVRIKHTNHEMKTILNNCDSSSIIHHTPTQKGRKSPIPKKIVQLKIANYASATTNKRPVTVWAIPKIDFHLNFDWAHFRCERKSVLKRREEQEKKKDKSICGCVCVCQMRWFGQ